MSKGREVCLRVRGGKENEDILWGMIHEMLEAQARASACIIERGGTDIKWSSYLSLGARRRGHGEGGDGKV